MFQNAKLPQLFIPNNSNANYTGSFIQFILRKTIVGVINSNAFPPIS